MGGDMETLCRVYCTTHHEDPFKEYMTEIMNDFRTRRNEIQAEMNSLNREFKVKIGKIQRERNLALVSDKPIHSPTRAEKDAKHKEMMQKEKAQKKERPSS